MVRPPADVAPTRNRGPRVNQQIDSPSVRLVGADGEMVGVVPIRQALEMAVEAGLDLVEVSPSAVPPVCKILDYGKFKYQEQKRRAEARKKQKVIEIKEIKMRPTIDDNDYNVKMRAMKRFLEEGD
ncbi:MAG TPA: translation initiation factor IF-3, partial [Alphaproteobacteria bacterium]|nr:translation initiation factor IF-3 [Alphaproteobacteria bacterium]